MAAPVAATTPPAINHSLASHRIGAVKSAPASFSTFSAYAQDAI